MKIANILGTTYTIEERTAQEDDSLKDADAYCDRTTKEIVLLKFPDDECTVHNPEWYRKKLLRHEIVHAFLFESGLGECSDWEQRNSQHSEQIVDWIAIQFPKMQKVFEEVGCL